MIDSQEAENKAMELIELSIKVKDLNDKIKTLKAELLEYVDVQNINEHIWMGDNGRIEIATTTKYKLADIPSEFKVPSEVAAIDVAQKAFKSKIVLSKEGKQMFKESYPTIVNLMIPTNKKELKVVV